MNTCKALVLSGVMLGASQVMAQEEENYEVVLPEAAQKCVLPVAPDAIPPEATYDQLLAAKQGVANFQTAVNEYRSCLDVAKAGPELTPGNEQAIVASFNYSVDMEERVAARFNDAVRSYKERQGEGTGEKQGEGSE